MFTQLTIIVFNYIYFIFALNYRNLVFYLAFWLFELLLLYLYHLLGCFNVVGILRMIVLQITKNLIDRLS